MKIENFKMRHCRPPYEDVSRHRRTPYEDVSFVKERNKFNKLKLKGNFNEKNLKKEENEVFVKGFT